MKKNLHRIIGERVDWPYRGFDTAVGTIHTGNMLSPATRAIKAASRREQLAKSAGLPYAVLTLQMLKDASNGETFD